MWPRLQLLYVFNQRHDSYFLFDPLQLKKNDLPYKDHLNTSDAGTFLYKLYSVTFKS